MSDSSDLPDRLDEALAAMWAGSSEALDRLVGGDAPPIGQALAASSAAFQRTFTHPSEIDGFEILGELGRGGMGIVYQARQRYPDRLVALKVIRGAEFVDEHRVRLFEREMQTLARLRHPNIAALYGAGQTGDGQHYFVMELFHGTPLHDFASQRAGEGMADSVAVRRIINVFCKVCDAIAHAHQKGVIHRDLKPSNILINVDLSDSEPVSSCNDIEVKVLDFGLARVVDGDAANVTATTDASRLRGTLPYMSPEQVAGDPHEVDVRTDVYSLGVVLYQLLTGRLPFDAGKRPVTELLAAIREGFIPRPAGINPVLRGELETILLKALERDPARRYQSAAAFADDLRRYLSNQPIQARPASFVYLSRKLMARHRLAFGAAALLLVVVIAAATISTSLLVQARAARDAAEKERRLAETVSRFLVDTFAHIDPRLAQNRDTGLLRELLGGAVQRTESELADQPQVRARLDGVFGSAYLSLGAYDQSEPHLVRALALSSESLGPEHPETLTAMNNLATLRGDQGRLNEAAEINEAVLAVRKRVLGMEHADTAMSMNNLAEVYRQIDRVVEAESLFQSALELRRRILGGEHPETLVTMNNLAGIWILQHKYVPAEQLMRECLEGQIRNLSADHLDTLVTKSDLSIVLQRNGKMEEAELLLREAVAGFEQQLGEGHMDTLIATYNLAKLESRQGRRAEAAASLARLTEVAEAHLPAGHYILGSIRSAYARGLYECDRFADAEPHAIQSLEELEVALGAPHTTTRAAAGTVADIYEALGQPERAAPYRAMSQVK